GWQRAREWSPPLSRALATNSAEHETHGRARGWALRTRAGPPDAGDAAVGEPPHRHVALPAAVAAAVAELHSARRESQHFDRQFRDLGDGNVVPRGDVVDLVALVAMAVRHEHGFDHVVDMDV